MKQQNKFLATLKSSGFRSFLAFLLPLLTVIFTSLALGIYPFGENTTMSADLFGQYTSAFAHLEELFSDGFFYSFSKVLGGDMTGFMGYYLLSPLNILLLFFPICRTAMGISVISMLKVALAGLTFDWYLSKKYGNRAMCLAFSTAYALSGFAAAFQVHPMWLDGAVLLPLIIFGIEQIFEGKSPVLYLVTLFLGIFSCYPIGWALLIFSILYMIYHGIISDGKPKAKLRSVGVFMLNSALSVGLSAFVWLPAILSSEPVNGGFIDRTAMETSFPFYQLIPKLLSGSALDFGLPQLFVGISAVLLTVLYFCNKNIRIKDRIFGGILLLFLTFSFYIKPLDIFWNGMTETGDFHFRYAFLFAFMAISMAAKCFFSLDGGVDWIKILSVGVAYLGLAVSALIIGFDGTDVMEIVIDMVMIAAVGAFLYFFCFGKKQYKNLFMAGIFLFTIGGSVYNYVISVESLPRSEEKIHDYIEELNPLIEEINDNDRTFFRMEKDFHYSANDPMLFSYYGISYQGIAENQASKYLENWGYPAFNNGSFYGDHGSTLAADGFFGVKYFLTKNVPDEHYREWIKNGDITAYVNPYAVPIGFTAKKHILKDFSTEKNTFEFQNDVFSAVAEDYRRIFSATAASKIKTFNLTGGEEDGYYYYKKASDEKEAYIDYEITIMDSNPLYVCFSGENHFSADLSLNGESLGTYTVGKSGIVNLGSYQPKKKLHLRLTLDEERLEFAKTDFYSLDLDLLKEFTDEIKTDSCELIRKSGSRLAGFSDVVSEGQYMLTTIPYDDNWEITIDGEKAEAISAAVGLLAAELPVGFHAIELKYRPDGWTQGAWISVGTLLIIAGYLVLKYRKKSLRNKSEDVENK